MMPPEAAAKSTHSSLDRLRIAARTLFARDGYHATRPQDIVREAGVANGTFYLHFKDKREAFLDFSSQAQEELLALYRERLDGLRDPAARWRAVFDAVIDFGRRNPGVLHAAFFDPVFIDPDNPDAWRMYDRMGHLVQLVIGDETALAELAETYDVELVSHALCGALRYAMIYAARKKMPRERLINELSRFMDRALARPPRDASDGTP